jgi:cytochrome P450
VSIETAMQADLPLSDIDPFSDAFLTDPYPDHERLREAGPVVRFARYGILAMARYDEVRAAFEDHEAFCSSAGVGLSDFRKEPPWRPPSLILEADPPLHTRTRGVLARVLSSTTVRRLRPAFERVAEELVDTLLARGTVDAIADVAKAYPLRIFPDAVGVRPDGREHLLPYGTMVFNAFGPRNANLERSMAEAQTVVPWINEQCRRESLAPGSLGAQIHAEVDAGEITADEAPLLVRSLLSAGLDTTVNAIGNALYAFAFHPEQWAILRERPALARAAFEEAIRFESPVQTFFRTTTRPVTMSGASLGEGEKVLLFLAAANRDERRFANASTFDITRPVIHNVGLGAGIHVCVGGMLARLEGEVLLGALARKVNAIEPAGEPVRRLNNSLRGLERFPIRLKRR